MRFGLSDFVFRVLVFRRSGVPAFRRSSVFPFGVESVEQRGTGIENDCLCVKESPGAFRNFGLHRTWRSVLIYF